jgi:hypothetical protein
MNWIQQQLGQMPEPDIILHIGAGLCSELRDYQRIQPSQIVLVEPNPETCAELLSQAADWDNVTVLQAAVTDRAGRASLRLFNFPELDSLHEPVGLYKLLPGLRHVGLAEVTTLSANQLIEQLPLQPQGHNWLVLEAPGEELEILTALADCQALERFSRLIVRAGSEAFYNDTSSSSPAVLETLEELGYTLQTQADKADADWPRHHLRLDHMALECRRLRAEYKADLLATAKALDSVKQLLAESERQHQTELEAIHQKQAQAEKESAQRIRQLETTQAEQKTASETLGTELHRREKEIATLKDKLAKAEQQVSSLPDSIAELETLTTQLNVANEKVRQYKAQAEKTQADLSLALRLQMLRENDLKELQTRYGQVLTIKAEQQDLLTQLHHRLSRAAEYLQLVHTGSEDQRLPDELLEAFTGKHEKSG